jgi:hypothetical protein
MGLPVLVLVLIVGLVPLLVLAWVPELVVELVELLLGLSPLE